VSVTPAGPMSGADHQNWPGSSSTQHAHKRLRISLAQRVVPTKPELCKANEGMTRAHARTTLTAAPPHHRPIPACRLQRPPQPVPRCPRRQCSWPLLCPTYTRATLPRHSSVMEEQLVLKDIPSTLSPPIGGRLWPCIPRSASDSSPMPEPARPRPRPQSNCQPTEGP